MIWPFENDTNAVVKRISSKNISANRKRNLFTILTIALATALLSAIMLYGFGVPQKTKNLNIYSFPWPVIVIFLAVLLVVQMVLIAYTTGNLKKNSLVEQIRVTE